MSFELTAFDKRLSESVTLNMVGADPVKGFPQGSSLIKFQFPPIITSESKGMQWQKFTKSMVWEHLYMWQGAEPRKITLQATYIVGGPPTSQVKKWTAARVATELRRFKAYFYNKGDPALLPIFQLNMYEHAPGTEGAGSEQAPTNWRGLNVSFKYSDAHVAFETDKLPKGVHPLRTDVTLTLEQVTNIQTDDGKTYYSFPAPMTQVPEQTWY